MSDLVLKSPLLDALNFKYSQESVIRFIGKRNITFFDCYGVSKATLLKLINYAIQNSDEIFHVSYNAYKASGTLFITPDLLSSKPYWFNHSEVSDLSRGSANTGYLTLPLTDHAFDEIEKASRAFEISKSNLLILSILTEYSPNPWVKSEATIESLAECALNLQENTFEKISEGIFEKPTGKSWEEISKALEKIAGEKASDSTEISAFIVKARNKFSQQVNTLKADKKYYNLNYRVRACRADGEMVRDDRLPPVFNVRDLDKLFEQNMEYFKHVLYLEVYDPFQKDTFIYHPKLIYILDGEPKPMFMSFPTFFVNWMNTFCSGSLRSRNSTIRQAIHNFLLNWKEQWESIPKNELPAVKSALQSMQEKFRVESSMIHSTEDGEQPIVRSRGRPRIRPELTEEEKQEKALRGRGRPRKEKVEGEKPSRQPRKAKTDQSKITKPKAPTTKTKHTPKAANAEGVVPKPNRIRKKAETPTSEVDA